jgi:hypothetical protein
MRSTQADRDGTRTISGTLAGTGAPVAGTGFSVVRTSAGVYTLRLPSRGMPLSLNVTPMAGANYTATCSPAADGSATVWSWNGAGVQTDAQWSFTATVLAR